MTRKNNLNSKAKAEQSSEELVKTEQPEKADTPDKEPKPPEEDHVKQVTILTPNVNYNGVIGGISFTSGKASLVPDNDPKTNRMISWFRENGYSVTFS